MPRLIEIKELKERFKEHSAMAELYVEDLRAERGLSLRVDDAALYLAIKSAYDDVERYKLYHQENPHEQKANAVKRVAYLTKWFMKLRPLMPVDKTDINDSDYVLSNASFGILVARAHISAELETEFFWTLQKEYELTYDLTYREITGDGLLTIFQNIYDLVRSVSIIEEA